MPEAAGVVVFLFTCSFLHFCWSFVPPESVEQFELQTALSRSVLCGIYGREECPVDGGWTSWGSWGGCHGTCGQTGVRYRHRYCTNPPPFNGDYCVGPNSEAKLCRYRGCTMDEYRDFAKCNAGRLDQFEVLDSIHAEFPSLIPRCIEAECHYGMVEKVLKKGTDKYWNALHCVKHNTGCPEYGGWSSWTTHSDCTAYCGQGKRVRCRTCSNPIPVEPKYLCSGDNCTFSPCAGTKCNSIIRGRWNDWNVWSECSASCGQGLQQRTRSCVHNKFSIERAMPHTHNKISSCSADVFRSKRTLEGVVSSDKICIGPYKEFKPCYIRNCPVDGDWSEWEPWSQCSMDCSLGLQSRSRACTNPPAMNGGEPCVGPVTWVRHCFIAPCVGPHSWIQQCSKAPCIDTDHDSAFFRGDGSLNYYKTGISAHLLHIFMKFKSLTKEGELVRRDSSPCLSKECAMVKLYLNAGHIVLHVTMGGCTLLLASYKQIVVGEWTKLLVTVTSSRATMRVGDSDALYRARLQCWKAVWPDFDGVMAVGRDFRGEISNLVVNYEPRYLKAGNDTHNTQRITFGDVNLAPFSSYNVYYNEGEGEEKVLLLNKMIFGPCYKSFKAWSIKMVLKTEQQDGIVMVIRDFYQAKYLILLFEPYRVVVQLEDGQCYEEVYQLVDHHLGEWFLVQVEYDPSSSISLEVNGGAKKYMAASITEPLINCEDNIMIGDVSHFLAKEANRSKISKHTSFVRSMKGTLAYLSVDENEIDLSKLPIESRFHDKQLSSEAASISKNYIEHRLELGKPLELGCLYFYDESSREIYAQVNWNYSGPIWLFSATPIVHDKLMPWGVKYNVEDKKYFTVLSAHKYTKHSIEGFYSCWRPWNTRGQKSALLVTYGVTVVVYGELLAGSHSLAVTTSLLILLAIVTCTVVAFLLEHSRGFGGDGAEFEDKTSKTIDRDLKYILLHSPELRTNFGITNKLVGKIVKFNKILVDRRGKCKVHDSEFNETCETQSGRKTPSMSPR